MGRKEPGSPFGALAVGLLSHTCWEGKEAPTMTQREPPASTKRFLVPPLSLSFDIEQEYKNRCSIHVRAFSGNHCFVHREIEAFYDTFHEIPVMIGSSMLSWTLWLVQFEAERRSPNPGGRSVPLARFPDWPSPIEHETGHLDVGF